MRRNQNFEKLKEHILLKSESTDFYTAKHEWKVTRLVLSETSSYCPCGQLIWEHCYIDNIITGASAIVGNVCVNHFMGVDMSSIFTWVKKLKKDPKKLANIILIDYAVKHRLINDWETNFLKNISGKRVLSEKQVACKDKINQRILDAMTR